ncbi:cbb3-type cytochrome oxidase assembly protein CcoS [Colwellia asteriadis]
MYILIPVAAILTALGIYLFFWAVKTEQFDDLEKQGMSILFNDDSQQKDQEKSAPSDSNIAAKANAAPLATNPTNNSSADVKK